jgi:hypothetical protein
MDQSLVLSIERLAREFDGNFSRETVERVVADSAGTLDNAPRRKGGS